MGLRSRLYKNMTDPDRVLENHKFMNTVPLLVTGIMLVFSSLIFWYYTINLRGELGLLFFVLGGWFGWRGVGNIRNFFKNRRLFDQMNEVSKK